MLIQNSHMLSIIIMLIVCCFKSSKGKDQWYNHQMDVLLHSRYNYYDDHYTKIAIYYIKQDVWRKKYPYDCFELSSFSNCDY